ncbi:unnamed protein product [Protopolystoma xenopodis]|uniref:Uncharacterized protein n=1 Tax=Protopolystoma xenopodis TaxID=117903 RepID=A0A3S5FDJ9_9PLAT|nr:unnamed protein product [Protopolystoma xenopodis]
MPASLPQEILSVALAQPAITGPGHTQSNQQQQSSLLALMPPSPIATSNASGAVTTTSLASAGGDALALVPVNQASTVSAAQVSS